MWTCINLNNIFFEKLELFFEKLELFFWTFWTFFLKFLNNFLKSLNHTKFNFFLIWNFFWFVFNWKQIFNLFQNFEIPKTFWTPKNASMIPPLPWTQPHHKPPFTGTRKMYKKFNFIQNAMFLLRQYLWLYHFNSHKLCKAFCFNIYSKQPRKIWSLITSLKDEIY